MKALGCVLLIELTFFFKRFSHNSIALLSAVLLKLEMKHNINNVVTTEIEEEVNVDIDDIVEDPRTSESSCLIMCFGGWVCMYQYHIPFL